MRPAPEVHDALARLLTYPGEGVGDGYPAAIEVVRRACPETTPLFDELEAVVDELESGALEELFTRTFDNVAERSLEIGWQLFGENYARAALMVRLRVLLRENGVPEGTELPDHLSHVLPLLGRAPEVLARGLATKQVAQAVEAVIEGLRAIESPWTGVLVAAREVLRMHAPAAGVQEVAR